MKDFIMTFVVVIVLWLVASLAEAQVVKGGGGGGLRQRSVDAVTLKHARCEEGQSQQFYERDVVEDHYTYVTRICKNGSFFEKSNVDYRKIRCTDGTIGVNEVRTGAMGNILRQTFRCIDGKRTLIRAEEISPTGN